MPSYSEKGTYIGDLYQNELLCKAIGSAQTAVVKFVAVKASEFNKWNIPRIIHRVSASVQR
jgi:hypothetical protein